MRLVSALALLFFVSCTSEPGSTPGVALDASQDTEDDVPPPDVAVEVLADSGCPAPAKLGPEQTPKGYLAPERVNLGYTVDGDTAHFHFKAGEKVVRFLFVDTEETTGAEKTDFGVATKGVIDGWLRAAKDIVVAVREGSTPGTPNTDPYGRWLGLVYVDGELLQTRIVREGRSAYYTQFGCAPAPVHDVLLHAEAEAWANKRGIWAPGHPTDYKAVLAKWMGSSKCRPNPYVSPYCP